MAKTLLHPHHSLIQISTEICFWLFFFAYSSHVLNSQQHVSLGALPDTETTQYREMDLKTSSKAIDKLLQTPCLILVAAGAGWSADSGLKTYEQTPNYVQFSTALAYLSGKTRDASKQWWLDTVETYQNTQPHQGYSVLQDLAAHHRKQYGSVYMQFLEAMLAVIKRGKHTRFGCKLTSNDLEPLFVIESCWRAFPDMLRFTPAMGTVTDYLWNPMNMFVVTTNVDGHFLKSVSVSVSKQQPSPWIYEMHGRLEMGQCSTGCMRFDVATAKQTRNCEQCLTPLRPNVLLFDDGSWRPSIEHQKQLEWFKLWKLAAIHGNIPVAILELGVGQNVLSLRRFMDEAFLALAPHRAFYIRVNQRASDAAFWTQHTREPSHYGFGGMPVAKKPHRNKTNRLPVVANGLRFAKRLHSKMLADPIQKN